MFYLIKNRGEKLYEANSIGLWLRAMNAIFLIQNARVVMQLKERLFGQRNLSRYILSFIQMCSH